MIRLGICTQIQYAERMAQIGFDYIEPALSNIAAMTDAEYDEARRILAGSGLQAEAMNGMMPGTIRLTGENVNAQQIHDYLDKAFGRAARLGTRVVVFGSGAARAVPEGFDYAQAWRQLANFLRMAERHGREHNIVVAIEPLRRAECNIINYVSEAMALASLVNMPHIGVLGDTYHMAMGSEPLEALVHAGQQLCHVHTANGVGRFFPKPRDGEDYAAIFDALNRANYPGRISIEGRTEDLFADAAISFRLLNDIRNA